MQRTAATHIPDPPRKAASDASAPCHACVQISRQKFENVNIFNVNILNGYSNPSTVPVVGENGRVGWVG